MDSTKPLNPKALDETTHYTASVLCMEHAVEDAAIIAHGIVSVYLTALSAQGEAAQPAAEGWHDMSSAPKEPGSRVRALVETELEMEENVPALLMGGWKRTAPHDRIIGWLPASPAASQGGAE